MAGFREMKRFYEEAAATEAKDGFTVTLDGKAILTPGRNPLTLPTRGLAEAVAAEWAAQEKTVRPQDMVVMSLVCTAIDLVRPRRGEVVAELADYGGTDLICYRAERPEYLVARQNEVWQPLVDWAALQLDVPLATTSGLIAAPQPEAALAALARAVEAHDDWALTGLATAVNTAGSLVIGLALSHGRLDAEGAFDATELHESHQIEAWGDDPDTTRRRAQVLRDLDAAARFLALLRE